MLKGKVTTVDNINKKARVTFENSDNITSFEIPFAEHIDELLVNDRVAVSFFTNNLMDGVIVAKF